MIDIKSIKQALQYENRNHFISLGNFLHPPNKDAVIQLKKFIWPKIKMNIPEAELHIYGAYLPDDIARLHNDKEGFIIKGRANDAYEVVSKAKVLLAPLRFGAGLKGKLIEAMECGTPSVTTDIGSEGMQFDLEWNGFIENDFFAFSESATKLYTDKSIWEKSLANGYEILSKKFDFNLHSSVFLERITKVRKEIIKHREENFMGTLLTHHQMQSTKYFSKWIEEKNKSGKT
jgi:glycosyltransferase involved in cell wall biosynthesis